MLTRLLTESQEPTYTLKDVLVELCVMGLCAPTAILLVGMIIGYLLA